jgi:hypothetical protein
VLVGDWVGVVANCPMVGLFQFGSLVDKSTTEAEADGAMFPVQAQT